MLAKTILALGALNGALAVALGAYGAHGLKDQSAAALLQTALHYHMFHTLGLLAIGAIAACRPGAVLLTWAGAAMLLGILLFCGSLYVHALTGYRGLGFVAPFGGIALILSWLVLAVAVLRA